MHDFNSRDAHASSDLAAMMIEKRTVMSTYASILLALAVCGVPATTFAQRYPHLKESRNQIEAISKTAGEAAHKISESPESGAEFRDTLRSGGQGPVLVRIPGGKFEQGSPSHEGDRSDAEGPLREVTLKPFAIGKYEVTRGQFRQFVEATNYQTDAEKNTTSNGDPTAGCHTYLGTNFDFGWRAGTSWRDSGFAQNDDHPVVCVSWNDAQAYTQWLRQETGKPYRLPSESELEYVNRAGTTTPWPWGTDGNTGCEHANHADATAKKQFSDWPAASCNDGHLFTAPVGSYQANAFGLHDTAGNAWEWSQDCWNENYIGAPVDGRAWTSGDCARRVLRGGSWLYISQWLRAAFRVRNPAPFRNFASGFRLAQD